MIADRRGLTVLRKMDAQWKMEPPCRLCWIVSIAYGLGWRAVRQQLSFEDRR